MNITLTKSASENKINIFSLNINTQFCNSYVLQQEKKFYCIAVKFSKTFVPCCTGTMFVFKVEFCFVYSKSKFVITQNDGTYKMLFESYLSVSSFCHQSD